MTAVLLEGLRLALEREAASREDDELPDESFGEGGVNEGVDLSAWDRIRDLVYQGRGG